MRPMPQSVQDHNQRFLDLHTQQYPHWVRTKRGLIDPRRVQFHLPEVAFLCAPLAEYQEWRFLTEEGLRTFTSHYVTEETRYDP